MLSNLLTRSTKGRQLVRQLGQQRTADIVTDVLPLLGQSKTILDLGSGACTVGNELRQRGFQVTLLDVADHSCIEGLSPQIYDGKRVPFPDDSFDTALLLDVLHHTPHPEEIVAEAARVAKQVIIHEPIFGTKTQKYLTFLMDSMSNLEFYGHPHTNKTDNQWRAIFKSLGLELVHGETRRFWGVFEVATYRVKKAR